MVRQVPAVTSPSAKEASIAAALEALRANRPLRAEEICRDYLDEQPGLRRAPAAAGSCARQAGALPGGRADRAARDVAAAGLPASARGSRQRARAAAASRRGGAVLRAGDPARAPPAARAHKKLGQSLAALGRGARGRRGLRGILRAGASQGPGRARDGSSARRSQERGDRDAAQRAARGSGQRRCDALPRRHLHARRRSGSATPRRCCGARRRWPRTSSSAW